MSLNPSATVRVLFVCMGNICRSPSAEGVFRALVSEPGIGMEFEIDSAGTHAYHVGEPPDPRATSAAFKRGIDISAQRARKVQPHDFERFDYILAMDPDNLAILEDMRSPQSPAELGLLLDYCPKLNSDTVPDPYYGGADGFEQVLDLLDTACRSFVDHVSKDSAI